MEGYTWVPREPDTPDGVYFEDPALPPGWTRKCVQRSTGATSGHWDVYVYNPMGKKFRSNNEVRAYLQQIGSDLEPARFSFNARAQVGMPAKLRRAGRSAAPVRSVEHAAKKRGQQSAAARALKRARGLTSQHRTPAAAAAGGGGDANQRVRLKFNFARRRLQPAGGRVRAGRWIPPRSPYRLPQQAYYRHPWRLLVSSILLSRAPGGQQQQRQLLKIFFERWPEAAAARDADETDMRHLLEPLGQAEKRAHTVIRFSDEFLTKRWREVHELYGIGRFGSDSYRMFCLGEWRRVRPQDHALSLYHNWLCTNQRALQLP